jgi:protein-L-isoaspartate(D-aspartate) O-methyltransferase
MAEQAPETRALRRRMVRTQLVARGIDARRVLAAMAWVPREWFVPPDRIDAAYDDRPLPIGSGQTISQPYVVAWMTLHLGLARRDRVLEVGTGSGYQTAVLARLAGGVYTTERLPDLLVEAEDRFRRLRLRTIVTRLGDGATGWPEQAPFDAIIVTAAVPAVPDPLREQLGVGGRLVIPVGSAAEQELVIVRRDAADRFTERRVGGVRFVPLISRLAFRDEPGDWRY